MKNEHDALEISLLSCALSLWQPRRGDTSIFYLHFTPLALGLTQPCWMPDRSCGGLRSVFETPSSSKSTCLTPPACLLWLDNLPAISTSLCGSCDWAAALLGLPLEHRGTGGILSLTEGFPSHDNASSASDSQLYCLNGFPFPFRRLL